jgi:tetratricopeptide (TPR) repeat protein
MRLGKAYELTGAPEKARQIYEDARKVNPNNVSVLVQLAEIYSATSKDSKQALALAREARKLAPDDPQIAHVLGRLAWREGDHVWASSLLQESARKLPNDAEVLYDLAHAWYSVGRLTDAEETMRRARQKASAFGHDQDAQWFLTLIDWYKSPQKRLEAEPQVQQLLKAKPDYAPALMVAGLIHEQRGRIQEARQAYETLLARNPQFAPARKQLARLYTDYLNDHQKAFEQASKARETLPEDPELAKLLGKIAYRRADYQNAARFLQDSSQKQPNDTEMLYFLGMTRYNLKETNETKQALGRALALNPDASFAPEAREILARLK